jgi:tetratricopeptide (TPR) repeat protein
MRAGLTLTLLLLAPVHGMGGPAAAETPADSSSPEIYRYHHEGRVPPSLEEAQKNLVAGMDAFPEEKEAEELAGRLAELGRRLREDPSRAADAVDPLLAPELEGTRLTPTDEVSLGNSAQLEVFRARTMPSERVRDKSSFPGELAALVGDFESLQTAEFLITAIEVTGRPNPLVRTTVRFDLAGGAREGGRAQRTGHWQMRWRRGQDSVWRVTEWTALDHLRSHAPAPVFTEVTEAAFGRDPSFRRQLLPGLDQWAAGLDGLFMPRAKMGHHGISVGDFDGDGRDDLYVSQPEGLPNRLFRGEGDSTFRDVTSTAGDLAVLERTSQSLFADVDNDGDEDLILLTRAGPMLFVNGGQGHFTRDPAAFRFEDRLQGTLTSGSLADYDRDGFVDLYLCTYGYFIGVGEDKSGPPSPYHDALNGSPNVLFRNDGHGRFVETTSEVGLDQNNDRFSFAAAWADYDEDGWPDLFVSNDFGRKNLYHNEGMVDGEPRFRDVAGPAGVEDYGAGMSATFFDYDGDGRLDIYAGNMWTAAGQRVTALPGLKPDASAEIREIYRRHARGNSLFRNRGDGGFEDVTLQTGAEYGRWAWSSDAFDFDSDGWEDLYAANGMFTRRDDESAPDVDSYFWRQVVAQSPLTRKAGTPYDDGWRTINRILASNGAQAQHERNVLLRNNGQGGFDEVSGAVGLDIDQDGRSFGVLDYEGDGDPDVLLLAPRSSPQLRLFRNDFAGEHASLVLRLTGTKSNRDAVGARVTVQTDQGQATRLLSAGSGFLSQHTKELLFGLGRSQRIVEVTIAWPSGLVQTLTDVPLNRRVWIEEGNPILRSEPFRTGSAPMAVARTTGADDELDPRFASVWLYEPFPAPEFTLRDLDGREHSLGGAAGRPLLLLFWATWAPPSEAALQELSRQREALAAAGAAILTVAVDPEENEATVRRASEGLGVPVAIATEEVAGTWSALHHHLLGPRGDLRLPTVFLVSAQGEIVKLYRTPRAITDAVRDIAKIDASAPERLARAVPFPGAPYSPPGGRSYFQYGLELSEQGFDAPALAVFEHVAKVDPTPAAFFNLGTLYMNGGHPAGEARTAFERALEMQPDYAEAANSLGALLAQGGDLPQAIERFHAALAVRPDFPDALNNLGYTLYQTGQEQQAFELYQKALALRPDFAEAYNNLGIYYGRGGDLEHARECFRRAVKARPGYGEAANNLALVLGATGDVDAAIAVIQRLLEQAPDFEAAYVTLARIYLQTGRRREGVQVLELLLQRNPTHPTGLAMLRELRAGG